MMRFRITLSGFGGMTTPVATVISTLPNYSDFSVKQRTLQGEKIIGQIAVAIAGISFLRKRINFNFSLTEPGLVSALKIG
jgi:hypothetical protein